jgi:peptidylprolyl isomerase
MRRRRPSLVLALLLFACAPTGKPPIAQGPIPESERGDAICGPGWKWDATHCVRSEEVRTASTGSGKTGGPTTARPAGSVASTAATTAAPPTGGLKFDDVTLGKGAEAHPGDTVRVHYTGSLLDGTTFDSSRPRGTPFEFKVGAGQVIRGFERGVVGMRVGGVRKVTIPAEMGYGRKGAPPVIPPNATLIFEIELLDVK